MHQKGFRLWLEPFFYDNIPFQINKISLMYACIFTKLLYICSALHFTQASQFANYAVGIFYAHGVTYSSDPRVER